ncbi:hypothetical protein EWM64_g1455 [Hericium alpestre]|uniref:Ketoreductase (KR) domain-containing protein n=1 Tax=Hericium alpestre TaxID=135208 RepID=A0A4Z0A7V1_9AGAM|nr:hypothetical protein EWM64_g1455 [Hericium alpestre]
MAKLTVVQFLRGQLKSFPPPEKRDVSGKTVVVVGANGGIGFEAAKHFARMNPGKLVLACRDAAKGQSALVAIKKDTGCENMEVRTVELADFDSVAEFATKFEQEEARLDILVYNAGVAITKYGAAKDGWETNLHVNYLSYSLLQLLLLSLLSKTATTYLTRPRTVVRLEQPALLGRCARRRTVKSKNLGESERQSLLR